MAAFFAIGYAKFTGRAGVCIATSGPGAVHLLNGLYDAKLLEYTAPSHELKMVPSSVVIEWPEIKPDDAAIARRLTF